MADIERNYRFYDELAPWWPLISPPEEYKEESAHLAALIGSTSVRVETLLELGSGGGHNAFHLKERFRMTLVDKSDEMLGVSRALNPECEHHQGDMRSVRLGTTFDAVLIHDAIDYMTTESELRQAMATAFEHCRPGGVAIFIPDHVADSFTDSTDCGGHDDPGGRGIRYLEWTWDPVPTDTWALAEYSFLIRAADGSVSTVHETHRVGLFKKTTWLDLLSDTGFEAKAVLETTSGDWTPREIFVCRRAV